MKKKNASSTTNSKRPLRTVLDELTSDFVDAVLAAARGALFDRETARAMLPERAARPVATRRPAPRVAASRPLPRSASRRPAARRADSAPPETATDLLITDPQALLTALETGGPSGASSYPETAFEAPRAREMPEILEPVAVAPPRETVPVFRAREGEQVLRSSGSNVVLRRRRA